MLAGEEVTCAASQTGRKCTPVRTVGHGRFSVRIVFHAFLPTQTPVCDANPPIGSESAQQPRRNMAILRPSREPSREALGPGPARLGKDGVSEDGVTEDVVTEDGDFIAKDARLCQTGPTSPLPSPSPEPAR